MKHLRLYEEFRQDLFWNFQNKPLLGKYIEEIADNPPVGIIVRLVDKPIQKGEFKTNSIPLQYFTEDDQWDRSDLLGRQITINDANILVQIAKIANPNTKYTNNFGDLNVQK